MFSDGEVVAAFLALAACAAIAQAITPKPRGWDNSRAATQKDVADVLKGGNRSQPGPDTTGLIVFLIFVFGIATVVL